MGDSESASSPVDGAGVVRTAANSSSFSTPVPNPSGRSRWGTTPFPIPTATMSLAEENTICAAGGIVGTTADSSPTSLVGDKIEQFKTEGLIQILDNMALYHLISFITPKSTILYFNFS